MSEHRQAHDLLHTLSRIEDECLDLELVRAVAGERATSTDERREIARLQEERGGRFYSDLLFALTTRSYEPERARALWNSILAHRDALEAVLGRRVGMAVASLDYLTNLCAEQPDFVNVPETILEEILQQATRDGLTGLYDHATFESLLRHEFERAKRYRTALCLLIIDIDDFKQINDRYGHPRGDDVIRDVSRIVGNSIRAADLGARYGGEEFVVILPDTGPARALETAERIRATIEAHIRLPMPVTVSIGVAALDHAAASDIQGFLKMADGALYAAKQAGKNRVVEAG